MISRSGAGAWLRGRRSLVTTLVSSAALVAVVATTAFVSTGYTAQKVELDDAAVWLTSDLHQAAGRANPQVGLLNAAVRMESGSLDVAQRGQTVVVSDLGGGEARLVDTANAEVSDTFSLPVGDARVELGDEVALLSSTTSGDVWVADPAALAAFDPQSPPDLTLGAGGSALLSSTGSLVAVSSATGSVFTLTDPASGTPTGEAIDAEPGDRLSLTAVGDRWVVYDHDERRLFTREGDIDLSASVGADDSVWLQRPSSAAASVLLATGGALLEVSLADGIVSTRSEGHSGTSVAPVQVDGCWYAAWTDGRSWARCDRAATGVESTREASASGDELVFRTDGSGGVLLSDHVTGRAWDVTRQNALIDGWEELLPDTPADEQSDDVVTDEPVETDPSQRPPVAGDDELGARPGRTTVLPVLLNDYDPNGDVVVIDGTVVAPDAGWTVDAIADSQQLQITLPPEASGEVAFAYTISDGRGGTDEATVRVQVRADAENSAPVQSTTPRLDVALGGRGEVDIRSDWFDPDGDAFYLLQAGTASPDAVSFTPEGVLTFTDSGQGTGQKEVSVTVSDGVSSTAGTVVVGVHEAADVPLEAEGFVAFVHVGQELEVDPLAHVTGGGSGLRLSGVPAHEGYGLAPDYAGGTLRITAGTVGEGLIDYAVSDGSKTASGVIRVIAELPPDASTRPVTVPHAAFARQNSSVDVDVLASDFDPAGGVLMVTGAAAGAGAGAAPGADGLRVEVIEQRLLRITLTQPLETGTLSVAYGVTNGLAEASGSVSVVEIPEPAVRQPPVATADSASVRVGDVVDIPVLANDSQPDGDALSLSPDLVRPLAADAGLLFTSGTVLRYLAPSTPGDFTAEYRVDAPDGQWSTATVTMSVREADPTVNAAPVPPLVTARVVAGETVRIPVPVAGIDPDGDSVQFVGIDSVPEKGAVAESGSDWIDYTAGDYSTGTDTFGYTVVDRLGARATGTVRVGVGARLEGARNPVAAPDEVLVRPGKSVLVRVLENDSDPDGSALTVTAVEPLGDGTGPAAVATVVEGGMLSVETPAEPGRYGFLYTVTNERGGTGSSFATVDVRADAPLARPLVSDTVLSLSDILDSDTVDVDVRENVFFAEGGAGQLWLSVLPAYARAAQVVDGEVRVSVRPERQVIPFTLAHPDDPNVRSSGFIWVPGQDDALPQLREGAPRLSVESGRTLRIPLAEQVVAVAGSDVVIADLNSVRATHADGGALTSGSGTLVFRSAEGYFGPASISFEVADGTGPDARTATLVLPITVTPRENQPPVFEGAVLELEPGARRVVDLAKLTTSTPGAGALAFQLLEPRAAGFGTVLLGQQLTITAD
uniref:Ig-like domain-containing protein n=1 Tax=Herbiconiux sp. TaxID=1871186 RepID=UPI0025BD7CC9